MIKSWKVTLYFLDDTSETFDYVTRQNAKDGVLSLYKRRSQYGPDEDHLGSWPLTSIQGWIEF